MKRFVSILLTIVLCVGLYGGSVSATEITATETAVSDSDSVGTEEALTEEISTEEVTTEEILTEETVTENLTEEDPAEEVTEEDILAADSFNMSGKAHIQTKGDTEAVWDGTTLILGTTGQAKRIENIALNVNGIEGLGIRYRVYMQTYRWGDWISDGQDAGTKGQAKRIEAMQIELIGEKAAEYSIYYRVHAQTFGWMDWAKNGEMAGSLGFAKRLECIQVMIVPNSEIDTTNEDAEQEMIQDKTGLYSWDCGTSHPSIMLAKESTDSIGNSGLVNYRTHVQTYGNQNWVSDGSVSGTYGEGKRLESINIKLGNTGYSGSITYRTHVQKYGWTDWVSDGAPSGTTGEGKRLEAIQIKLEGEVADYYDVYYRVHCQKLGWMGWTENGQMTGTAGYAFRLEGIQIVLVPKNSASRGLAGISFDLGQYDIPFAFLDGTGGYTAPVKCGLDHLGLQYKWAGSSWTTGVDCSGFTMMCYKSVGINLPHNSDMQGRCGREVSFSELKAGDLIVYPSDKFFARSGGHVAMYIGSGMMIESSGDVHISYAPTSGKNLKFVRIVN